MVASLDDWPGVTPKDANPYFNYIVNPCVHLSSSVDPFPDAEYEFIFGLDTMITIPLPAYTTDPPDCRPPVSYQIKNANGTPNIYAVVNNG